jgi:HEPN domain-containing protein
MNDSTLESVRQWFARARADWETVNVLLGNADSPAESIAFHCQQYVEKLLKAFLTMHHIEAPRTHDVRRLVQLAAPLVPELKELMDSADTLTDYAVAVRYPDEWREIEAEEVQAVCTTAKRFAAILLPLVQQPIDP